MVVVCCIMVRMKRIYTPTNSPEDWRRFLADPEKQWRTGYSAREMAECWERSNGFPSEFASAFESSENPDIRGLRMLMAIPEYKVNLPGGVRPSQNDLFVLARTFSGANSVIMVEGKVSESFGDRLDAWLKNASEGKLDRLAYIKTVLGISSNLPPDIRYQLLHRTASAVIVAEEFNACYAMMIVHSFSQTHEGFEDFKNFIKLFGMTPLINQLSELPSPSGVRLIVGWIDGSDSKTKNNY